MTYGKFEDKDNFQKMTVKDWEGSQNKTITSFEPRRFFNYNV